MSPLLNPRHEAFAFALAFGSTPAEAYLEAGFNPKNRKARAQLLADDPLIVNRVEQLLQEDPALEACSARHRNAKPFTIIPQSADELAQYVWQIIKGTRHVTAIQWQAIRFLGRLKRWDRSGQREPGRDVGLSFVNRESLAILDAVQIARDTQLHRAPIAKNDSHDDAADGAANSDLDQSEFEPVALFDPDAPIYPHDPDYVPTEEDLAEHAAELAAQRAAADLLNPPDTAPSDQGAEAAIKTAESSPQDTVGEPENPHLWTNVDSNPHAQLPDNQPLTPENPHLWTEKEKSTSASHSTKSTPTKKSLRPLPQASAARTPSLASKALATEAAVKNPNTPDSPPAPDTALPPVPVPSPSHPPQADRPPLPPVYDAQGDLVTLPQDCSEHVYRLLERIRPDDPRLPMWRRLRRLPEPVAGATPVPQP